MTEWGTECGNDLEKLEAAETQDSVLLLVVVVQ